MRSGLGIDTHRFAEGRPLILGGVEIPHDRGLDGHSDADVLAHAITDAMLGAAALGDIGQHFPDTDPEWKGADSIGAAARGGRACARRGLAGRVRRRDGDARAPEARAVPRGDHGSASSEAVGAQVHVKATTGERMGFVGREEGVAALAVATLVPCLSQRPMDVGGPRAAPDAASLTAARKLARPAPWSETGRDERARVGAVQGQRVASPTRCRST